MTTAGGVEVTTEGVVAGGEDEDATDDPDKVTVDDPDAVPAAAVVLTGEDLLFALTWTTLHSKSTPLAAEQRKLVSPSSPGTTLRR